MLLTSYSCDNFCCSCCTVFGFTHWYFVTGTKPLCFCRVEKAEKLRDIFSLLLGDPSAAEKLCSKILFYYSWSKHVHEEIWPSSVWNINKLPSENSFCISQIQKLLPTWILVALAMNLSPGFTFNLLRSLVLKDLNYKMY